jgi:hypothetical protein
MTDTLQNPAAAPAASNGEQTGTLTADEIIGRHPGKWVLMRVTKYDEDAWPERGDLLEVAPTQEEILDAFARWVPTVQEQGGPLYTFIAEPLISSGPEYTAAVAEFVAGLIRAAGEHDANAGR